MNKFIYDAGSSETIFGWPIFDWYVQSLQISPKG